MISNQMSFLHLSIHTLLIGPVVGVMQIAVYDNNLENFSILSPPPTPSQTCARLLELLHLGFAVFQKNVKNQLVLASFGCFRGTVSEVGS